MSRGQCHLRGDKAVDYALADAWNHDNPAQAIAEALIMIGRILRHGR